MTSLSRMPGTQTSLIAVLATAALSVNNPDAARAAEMQPPQAEILEGQVREGLRVVLGPLVKLSNRPVQITAAGDHFDIAVPTAYDALDGNGKVRITAAAHPATSGTWVIENIRITSPLRLQYDVPVPADGHNASRTKMPVIYTLNIEGQDSQIIWDPSFASTSVWTTSTTGMTIHTEAGPVSQESKVGPSNSVTTLRPVGADRADLLVDGTLQDYVIDSLVNDAPMHIAMQRIKVTSALKALNRSHAIPLLQTAISLALTSFPQPNHVLTPASPKFVPEVFDRALDTIEDFASSFSLDETIDGLAIKVQDQSIGMERLSLGLSAQSDGGVLQAGMDLAMDGLALPDMPLGEMAALIPRKIALHPVVSGAGVTELMRIAHASANGHDPAPADVAALFDHGGLGAALESMTVDVAGAVFSGQAKLLATGPSPDLVSGTAQISAEHFDDMMQRVSAIPQLAKVVPIIVFAKGIGRSLGDRLVWDLSYKQGKLLVNNMDLTALAGGASVSPPGPAGRGLPPGADGMDGGPKRTQPRSSPQKQAPSGAK